MFQPVFQAQVQNLETGAIFNHRFRSAESVEPAKLDFTELQFSYKQADDYVFMDNETYEMTTLTGEVLGDRSLLPALDDDWDAWRESH